MNPELINLVEKLSLGMPPLMRVAMLVLLFCLATLFLIAGFADLAASKNKWAQALARKHMKRFMFACYALVAVTACVETYRYSTAKRESLVQEITIALSTGDFTLQGQMIKDRDGAREELLLGLHPTTTIIGGQATTTHAQVLVVDRKLLPRFAQLLPPAGIARLAQIK